MFKKLTIAGIVAIALSLQIAPSNAVTIGFGADDDNPYVENGFSFNVARIVKGNCATGPCMALNKNETSVLTRVGGGLFSLNSFWFKIFGSPATLAIKSFNGANIVEQLVLSGVVKGQNSGLIYNHVFNNVTSISFRNAGNGGSEDNVGKGKIRIDDDDDGKGNVRIDDLNLSIPNASVVPVPAALPLFLTGMAGLGLYSRRRRRSPQTI
jgi:hypothetical protein